MGQPTYRKGKGGRERSGTGLFLEHLFLEHRCPHSPPPDPSLRFSTGSVPLLQSASLLPATGCCSSTRRHHGPLLAVGFSSDGWLWPATSRARWRLGFDEGKRGKGEKRHGAGWWIGPNCPSIAKRRISHDRRAPYPATKGRPPRPSSPQSPERNETWKDSFTPVRSAKTQG
jgi:hypothetical protein